MAKRAVIIVGADKGGVGKTTVTRTLLDYFSAHQVATRAFDTEWPNGTLKRFYPAETCVIDVAQAAHQMTIFDTIHSPDAVTVIDMRAGSFSPTLQALRDIGVFELAKSGYLTLAVFHVLGASLASVGEIGPISSYLGDARYVLVKNFINNAHFFDWDQPTSSTYFKQIRDAAEIVIPKLTELATEQVDLASVPYLRFVADKNQAGAPAAYSFVLRGYVRHWLAKVWKEYDRIGLLDLVDAHASPAAVEKLLASA
jgi:hypothetical protein